ncbi:MAG: hypothetical protein ABI775_11345 [Pseudonocardiales bacterium]
MEFVDSALLARLSGRAKRDFTAALSQLRPNAELAQRHASLARRDVAQRIVDGAVNYPVTRRDT